MDWLNEESYDYLNEDNFTWSGNNALSQTKSEVSLSNAVERDVCSKEVQVSFVNCQDSSFTSAFERLALDTDVDSSDDKESIRATCDAQTDSLDRVRSKEIIMEFKTREKPSLRLVVQGPEILNYQGIKHAPEDIAQYWKKDSRMWLWKSVRHANKNNREKFNLLCASNHKSD